MDSGTSKLRNIFNKVQTSTEEILKRNAKTSTSSSSISPPANAGGCGGAQNGQLDLNSAIEYNHYLINEYLQERQARKPSLYQQIIAESDEVEPLKIEQAIIDSVDKEFFLESVNEEESEDDEEDDSDVDSNDAVTKQDVGVTDVSAIRVSPQHESNFTESNHFPAPAPDSLPSRATVLELCVLRKLPPLDTNTEVLLTYLQDEQHKLEKQQTIINKRLTDMIEENNDKFTGQMTKILEIDQCLKGAITVCSNGRLSLQHSRRDFTTTSLSIVDNNEKRETVVEIIRTLKSIKQIGATIEQIRNLLELEKNFSCAIKLYHETSKMINALADDYLCVREMNTKLLQVLTLAEEHMDSALSKMPQHFCPQNYQQLVNAYFQIDKLDDSTSQLMMHFQNAIHEKTHSIVLGYVELFENTFTSGIGKSHSTPKKKISSPSTAVESNGEDLRKKSYAELCQHLNCESFLPCLKDLCRSLWVIIRNYFKTLCFYRSHERLNSSGLRDSDVLFTFAKLESGIGQIWADCQQKILTIVQSVKFVEFHDDNDNSTLETSGRHQDQLLFPFEEFIKILAICEKMVHIGEEFTSITGTPLAHSEGSTSELKNILQKQTRAYFQSYHQVSMAELKIFLENETWNRCPIDTKNDHTLLANLQEFAFLKNRLLKSRQNSEQPELKESSTSSFLFSPTLSKSKDYFAVYFSSPEVIEDVIFDNTIEEVNPLDEMSSFSLKNTESTWEEGIAGEDNNEAAQESHEEWEIIATNTALNLVRLTGRYMHVMYLLRSISHDVIKALMELYDYYFFTVYQFFAVDVVNYRWLSSYLSSLSQATTLSSLNESSVSQTPEKGNNRKQLAHISKGLRTFVKRINEQLVNNSADLLNTSSFGTSNHNNNNNNNSTTDLHTSQPSVNISQVSTPTASPKRVVKYPSPSISPCVPLTDPEALYALHERILAIGSLIFIARQFYNLCPFLMDFLRVDDCDDVFKSPASPVGENSENSGFKLLQFYHDEISNTVESLMEQCFFAVATKLLPFEHIISSMNTVKWNLKDIPSIHSPYVDEFLKVITNFNQKYRQLLEREDLHRVLHKQKPSSNITNGKESLDLALFPLMKLELISDRVGLGLWECLVRIINRCFVEGFSTAKKCTNEGRALMQLDYQQFLSNLERILQQNFTNDPSKNVKNLLNTEKVLVEEYIKAYYLTEVIFIDWIRQRTEYTNEQILSLINCISNDNRKLKNSLLAAIEGAINETT